MLLRDAVNKVYENRADLIVVGLTGVTGSGCSTIASILEKEKFSDLDFIDAKTREYNNSSERKQYVISKFLEYGDNWQKFEVIDVSSIILGFVFETGTEELKKYIDILCNSSKAEYLCIVEKKKLFDVINVLGKYYKSLGIEHLLCLLSDSYEISQKVFLGEKVSIYLEQLKDFKIYVRNEFQKFTCCLIKRSRDEAEEEKPFNFYTYIMQKFGRNLRTSGVPFESRFEQGKFFSLAISTARIIDELKERKKCSRFCIDAIRNPYEAMYLRDRYRHFYLVAVSADDRNSRLANIEEDEIQSQDEVENAEKVPHEEEFYRQNIRACTEIADIHIYNPKVSEGKFYALTEQITRYVALMLHPGLVTPSPEERCMQLAYIAKFNSGCLSRQVGAVVTRNDYSIQSIGWNDVAKGQVPCNLRDVLLFCRNKDKESFSKFERENEEFEEALCRLEKNFFEVCHSEENSPTGLSYVCGRCFAYCFKDVYNGIKDERNQVYTRSLHAEENAFLQISKYGGTGVKGSFLFTTASPCELCAKKAYQLGISKIFFIDPYPGISIDHILSFGTEGNPKVIPFRGAIGDAYVDLYRPYIAFKDEIAMITDIDAKKLVKPLVDDNQWDFGDLHYTKTEFELEYIDEQNCVLHRKVALKLNLNSKGVDLVHNINWSGVLPQDIKVVSSKGCKVEIVKKVSPYKFVVSPNRENEKTNQKGQMDDKKPNYLGIQYEIIINAKDVDSVMETCIGHRVRYKTDELILRVKVPVELDCVQDMKLVEYADFEMKHKVNESEVKSLSLTEKKQSKYDCYEVKIGKTGDRERSSVSVNYVYRLEWKKKSGSSETGVGTSKSE